MQLSFYHKIKIPQPTSTVVHKTYSLTWINKLFPSTPRLVTTAQVLNTCKSMQVTDETRHRVGMSPPAPFLLSFTFLRDRHHVTPQKISVVNLHAVYTLAVYWADGKMSLGWWGWRCSKLPTLSLLLYSSLDASGLCQPAKSAFR
jgi:hypothetical protein